MINSIFKKVFYSILRLFTQLDLVLFKIFKKRIFDKISKYTELHAITKINILNKKIAFYTPNENTKWRIENFTFKFVEIFNSPFCDFVRSIKSYFFI